MTLRIRGFVLSLICLFVLLLAPPAQAVDLDQARAEGARLASALAIGSRGDWSGAEAAVAGEDQLLRDIVLWRKLRSGNGSVAEYRDYMSRRASWPGQDILARVVLKEGGGGRSSGLGGQAAENWAALNRLYKKRDYEAAETFLLSVTDNPASLGVPKVWADRRLTLARRAAREGRHETAYQIAAQHHLRDFDGYDYADAEWVAGWVALRKLNDPARALPHFQKFWAAVDTPISKGRGGYWLGRTYEAAGDQENAKRWYGEAALQQTSFYGQLAAAAINAPGDPQLAANALPDWRTHPAMRLDDVRLAVTLYHADEDDLAMAVFSKLGETMPEGALAPLTRLVLDLGQPHYAVRIAKKAARRGVVIHPAYYPLHDLAGYASSVESAFAMSVARQETELNPRAISRAGARGLMQLMPATAQKVSGWIGEAYDKGRLLSDWRYNARLGQTYLARRTEQFSGSYVMAAAAYNAGAGRVDQWNAAFGDPRTGQIDILDWMEQIPFDETRNYVQRVMEGLYVYRTRMSGQAGPMTIVQDLARGIR